MSEERKEEFLLAFIRAFCKYGLDGTTAKKLAEEAGISPGGLYVYYQSKEEIILSCVQMHFKKVREETSALYNKHGDRMDMFVYSLFDFLKTILMENRFILQVLAHPYYSTMVKGLRHEHIFTAIELPKEERKGLSDEKWQVLILLCNSAFNNYVLTQDEESCRIQLDFILNLFHMGGRENE